MSFLIFRISLAESCVGTHLVNGARASDLEVFYWRHANKEVDFVLAKGRKVVALDVKSTRRNTSVPEIDAEAKEFEVHRKLRGGGQGIPLEEFLTTDVAVWF